ncbi:hypothetical protein [Aquella oligotrophica]|uniref:Uncharacterized protein n=1 Tax=Aquella oligotrophica TaxID=2067065 RepID=A0A2I7N5W5_9NEIS|nr:hypothetical protein [Aquella oligotrophica]AUR51821.1 hypothetical protein CUN60_05760 [Aquella oligotrophica]
MKRNKINLIAILTMGAALFACSSGSSSSSANTATTNQKIVAYTKDGKLYEWDMFLAGKVNPALRVHYIPGKMPSDIKTHVFDSLNKFEQALPQLDARFSNPPVLNTNKKAKMNKLAGLSNAFESTAGGLFLGVIPSTQNILLGSGNSECYASNPYIEPDTVSSSSSFVVTTANQQNQSTVSNSDNISVGFAGFSTSNSNTYANSYESANATSSYNLAAALAAVVQTGVPSTNNLTSNSESMYQQYPNEFLQNCGSSALEAYIGGILTTLNMNVTASSQSAAQSFSDSVAAGYNSDSVSNAYTSSSSNSSNYSAVDFTYDLYGDVQFVQTETIYGESASYYSSYIANAMAGESANYIACTANPPDMSACSNYNSAMSSAILAGMGYAQTAVEATNSTAYTTLYPFSDGININTINATGITSSGYKNPTVSANVTNANIQIVAANSPNISESNAIVDPYANYAPSLINAIGVAYQLNTLAARANFLGSMPGLTTSNEASVLKNIANSYLNDSNRIITVANNCYDAIMESYPTLNPSQCNENIVLQSSNASFSLSGLPNNVYQLYGNSTPASGSLQELLLNNSVALQYEINYSEVGTGYWNGDMIRGGNMIQLGMAYFNQSENSSEFGNSPASTGGYIYPSVTTPTLGTTNNNTYYNYGTSYNCTQWWQPLDAGGEVCNLVNYPTSSLYFVSYTSNKSQPMITFGQTTPATIESVGLNKVIAAGSYTQDSSKSQNYATSTWGVGITTQIPSIAQLAAGSLLMNFSYTTSGFITTTGTTNTPSHCYAGVYLPNVDTGNSTIAYGYGNPNGYNYLCGSPSGTAWLALSNNPTDAFTVNSIQQTITFTFSPISNFFGFNWWQ